MRFLTRLLNSRIWILLSIGCSFFALYEGVEKIIAGHEIEGVLELLVMMVIAVNLATNSRCLPFTWTS